MWKLGVSVVGTVENEMGRREGKLTVWVAVEEGACELEEGK